MDLDALRKATREHVQQTIQKEGTPVCLSKAEIFNSLNFDSVIENVRPLDDKSSVQV